MTKQEIIADESSFQRVCGVYVRHHIGPCVSSLMYGVGQNLEECSRIFDFDYDEAMGWFQVPDYEAAVDYFIDSADLDDLETIADMAGDWSDVVGDIPTAVEMEDEDGTITYVIPSLGISETDEDDANNGALEASVDKIRSKVKAMIPDQSYQEINEHFNLEPDYIEIYEHWIVESNWFADQLKEYGQVVFEFGGLTIFGRCTSGQSLSLDGWARSMVRDLPEDHWVWGEA